LLSSLAGDLHVMQTMDSGRDAHLMLRMDLVDGERGGPSI